MRVCKYTVRIFTGFGPGDFQIPYNKDEYHPHNISQDCFILSTFCLIRIAHLVISKYFQIPYHTSWYFSLPFTAPGASACASAWAKKPPKDASAAGRNCWGWTPCQLGNSTWTSHLIPFSSGFWPLFFSHRERKKRKALETYFWWKEIRLTNWDVWNLPIMG